MNERAASRPANVARTSFHVASGLVSLAMLVLVKSRLWLVGISGAIALWGYSMEIARRLSPTINDRLMRLFSAIAHPRERHQVNSSTWYVSALLLMALFFPRRGAEVGVLVLALADPAASIVGRRFGRRQLAKGRSLEGTLAFFAVGFLAAAVWLVGRGAGLPLSAGVGAAVALVGALVELSSAQIDDNFAVPLSCAAVTSLLLGEPWTLPV